MDGRRAIADFIPINGIEAVCQEVRDLIESMEPGMHQFVPINIRRPRSEKPIYRLDGRVLADPYYILQPLCFLDSIWVERSDATEKYIGLNNWISINRTTNRLVLRKEVVKGHHLWMEARMTNPVLMFSDDLVHAIKGRGFKEFLLHYCPEE